MRSALEGMVRRFCACKDGVYDSLCVEAVNEAFRALAVEGWFEIVEEDGCRLKGRLVSEPTRRLVTEHDVV